MPQPKRQTKGSTGGRQTPANINALIEALTKGLDAQRNLMMLTRERILETFEEAVKRGRITRSDANDLAAEIVRRGRKQTEDILAELLGERGRELRKSADKATDRVLREVDRARRATGIGSTFPISGYDDLTAAQVTSRLSDLTAPQLRKVRDYERRHGNRKSVLNAIEKKLA
jgi:polyhydroxyalkanoate synthesis regulator phasin